MNYVENGVVKRVTHGRHCDCGACAREDWTNPKLAHCDMHGPLCPPVYAPYRGDENWLRGDWMQTYTGKRFYPLSPRPEDIDHLDIAHALSLLCRYGGHVERFYSVAEHCVLMSRHLADDPKLALYALLHDATEAYVCDVPRPLKRQLVGYSDIEDWSWIAITGHFGISPVMPPEVKEADNRILLTERNSLMPRAEKWVVDDEYTPLPVTITGWGPERAEGEYLYRLNELIEVPVNA